MRGIGTAVDLVLEHSRAVIALTLLLTVVVGAGAPMVGQSSSLDQFQTDSPESEKLDYIQSNFSAGDQETTTAQVILRDDDVLDQESLVALLEYQQTLRENETVNRTLGAERGTVSVANVLATAAITAEEGRDVQRLAVQVESLNRNVSAERQAIAERNETLAATAGLLREQLTSLRSNPNADIDAAFEDVQANTSVELNGSDRETFRTAAQELRNASTQSEAEAAYRLGTRGVLAEEYRTLEQRADELAADADRLQELSTELQAEQAEYRNASNASLEEQQEQLRSMNESSLNTTIDAVLGGGGGTDGGPTALGFMPTSYDPGSTDAEATMLLVTMEGESNAASGTASEQVTDGQLAIQQLGRNADGGEYLVFGAGIIGEEINNSMTDSILIVGPLAVLFVLAALIVAYRDLLDILLGLVGIGAVLLLTFGFMGWTGVDFNQIFIAVPVLLIGLSIDYAIHIFMRHREERGEAETAVGPRASMRTALTGVGIALVYVTATTVIGFLSNLTSPVPPIQDFGIVSSVGILSALLVFAVLMPAVKVELDELLERWGYDRQKRAFGTGGGAFSTVLAVGSTAARKSPYLIIVAALLLSAGGAYGATQVDTSFEQSDFLAEEPPDWMNELPEPFAPGEYTAKKNLEYVNQNFVREDSQAQILLESRGSGGVTQADVLERIDAAERTASDKPVVQELPNGEARITSPLSVMRAVARENESFNESFVAADSNGDGVPDRNIGELYDELYEVAPDRAAGVIDRADGEYVAVRMTVPIEGGASGDAVTEQMRAVASELDGDGLEATATGNVVLNKIVQDELLETVIQSLVITLVATFLFLMVAYRLTEGSATLGVVTLMPVALSVTWILGTMYLLDIPFNVLTGMITSLTVGLGVAYSIHLSERYNQELQRTGEMWTAMDRAVTGTGGALLGSAATTVGGFGVLVFAILPPLQQFGKITGLTIIYAFLASVLVLPSLLAVWTRFVGRETAGDERTHESDSAALPTAAGESPATEAVAASGPDSPYVNRQFERAVAAPGETVVVTVTTAGVHGRTVLSERAAEDAAIIETTPMPAESRSIDGVLYVAWESAAAPDADEDAPLLRYRTTVPPDAADGDRLEFSGELLVGGERVAVEGEQRVEVVSDVFERVTAAGTVSESDLSDAYDSFAEGALSATQLDRIHRAWARNGASELRSTEEE
ncbi:MAG: MMPL family transporter [Halolamina sp.]